MKWYSLPLIALLALTSALMSAPKAQATSAYDYLYDTTDTVKIKRTGCPAIDVTKNLYGIVKSERDRGASWTRQYMTSQGGYSYADETWYQAIKTDGDMSVSQLIDNSRTNYAVQILYTSQDGAQLDWYDNAGKGWISMSRLSYPGVAINKIVLRYSDTTCNLDGSTYSPIDPPGSPAASDIVSYSKYPYDYYTSINLFTNVYQANYPPGYAGKMIVDGLALPPLGYVAPNVRGTIDKDGNMLIIADQITGYNDEVKNNFNNCSLWQTSLLVNEGGTQPNSELKWTSGKYKLSNGGGTLRPDYKLKVGDVVTIVTNWDSIPTPCADWKPGADYLPQKSIITISWDGKANLFNAYETNKDGHCTESDDTITCTVPLTNWTTTTTVCVSNELPYIHVDDCVNLYNQFINNLIFNDVQLLVINGNSECHNLGKLGDWLNLPSSKREICPAFNEDVRNTVTPFISIVVGLTIIGVVAKWYRGHND